MIVSMPAQYDLYRLAKHIFDTTGVKVYNKISMDTNRNVNVNVKPADQPAVTAAIASYVHNPGATNPLGAYTKAYNIQMMEDLVS